MKTIDIGKHKVEIYDSIDELPVKRFHKFNKYLLVDAGVGSDLNDINEKIGRIMRFVELSDKINANMELENLRQALYLVSQGTNVRHLALMALIKSVDGIENSDLSEEKLRFLQKQLGETSVGFFNRLFHTVKKKIDREIDLYFPGQFDDAAVKEYHDKVKSRILLQLDHIIHRTDNKEEIQKIDDFLMLLVRPRSFSGKESTEIKYDKQFEDMCLFLSQELSLDIDKLSVLQFYNSFEYIKKQRKKNGR